jgi:hypothetical protein
VVSTWVVPAGLSAQPSNSLSVPFIPAVRSHNSFHEKAGRGQDTLRFFLSVSLFPFS